MSFHYYNMGSYLKLGEITTSSLTSASGKSSLKELSDTCTITLPRAYRQAVIKGKKDTLERKNITDYLKVGDEVLVALGYDDELHEKFVGYIKKISADVPLVLECEDEMYKLRKTNFSESFKSITLLQLLKKIAPGYTYEVIDDIPLGKFIIANSSAFETLEALRNDYLLHSYFKGNKLIVGFPTDFKPQNNYTFNTKHMRSSEALEFIKADDVKIEIKAISNNSNGTKTVVTVGDSGGSVRTLNFANKSKTELENLAKKQLSTLKFDGYQGSFEIFGIPLVKVGDAVTIVDDEHSERDGKYLVESVEWSFDNGGYKQTIKPSYKL